MTSQELQKLATRLLVERQQLEPAQFGKYEITRRFVPAGEKMTIVSMRDCIFTSQPLTDVVYKTPTAIHELKGPSGVWMSDQPCELVQMHEELALKAKGRVLIGGLGLGVLTNMVNCMAGIESVTTVERSRPVVQLMGKYDLGKVTVANIFAYADKLKADKFDVALLDTWQGTGEWVWQNDIVPLRRQLVNKVAEVYCWHEQTMLGQVITGCYRAASLPADIHRSGNWHYRTFRLGLEKMGIRSKANDLPESQFRDFKRLMDAEQKSIEDVGVRYAASRFLTDVGSPFWEKTFGVYWDQALAEKEKVA